MHLRVLLSIAFFSFIYDFRVFSIDSPKSIALHEVDESVIQKEINARHNIGSKTSNSHSLLTRLAPFNYCGTLSKLVRSKYQWKDVSFIWQKRFRRFGYWVCFRDCGGGGDCLYSSIISSLNLNNTNVSSLRMLVADRFVGLNTTSIYSPNKNVKAVDINKIIDAAGNILSTSNSTNSTYTGSSSGFNSTEILSNWNETIYLERMNILATMEAIGEWQDSWSPASILNNDFVYGVDVSTNIKKAFLVHKLLSKPGNTHWGNEWDVNYIESIYDVKVIILWKNRGIFYPTLGNKQGFKRIVLIYYDDYIGHFQVVGIKKMNSSFRSDLLSVFEKERVPTSLKKLYKDDTSNDLE
ncbi:uncharacterized protein cubi_02694 [Cryptosporidium ubiquitum]|uniref:OTU domain-containing protein n=1 Tax=Cryptosporidium ubiquitum TaxID=857276 RepID=A0A1J4MLJ5_9CRYT|nr:uncharacterized protein cubi_02694 [Cryptosporidium ubiquitum]OII73892.1 hypothetical protein cubi_02694 [Cryptosporidium ubiquitum]